MAYSHLPTGSPAPRILWEQCVAPARLVLHRADVLFCPLNVTPLLAPCPTVVTVHDLAFLRFKLHKASRRNYLSALTRVSARRAAHVITVSEFTRQEVIDLLSIHPQRVTAIPNGKDECLAPVPPAAAREFRARKGLPDQFLLFIGTLEPRKNLATLLRAYASARDAIQMPLLIGGGKGWWFDEIFRLTKELSLESHVRFLGFVPAEELPLYYGSATALVYPSLYEGFGLPPLEAMAAGLPVITSDAGAITEVVRDAALVVPATDVPALARAIVRVATEESLRRDLSTRGLARAADFSWDRAAAGTLEILLRAARRD